MKLWACEKKKLRKKLKNKKRDKMKRKVMRGTKEQTKGNGLYITSSKSCERKGKKKLR
jgi:hypothetical protein